MRLASLVLIALVVMQKDGDRLHGVVVSSATQQPVAGATVMLVRPSALADAVVVSTDDRGAFSFDTPAPGTYRLVAEHADYVREMSAEIVVKNERTEAVFRLALTPTAVISGRVTDEFGEPIGKVYVRALTTRAVAEVRTNDLGEYRLFGLAPGEYVISAERYAGPTIQNNRVNTPTPPCPDCRGEGTMMQPLASLLPSGGFIDPRALTGQIYPAVFYPGVTERGEATPVKAGPGARIDGIDLKLIVK